MITALLLFSVPMAYLCSDLQQDCSGAETPIIETARMIGK